MKLHNFCDWPHFRRNFVVSIFQPVILQNYICVVAQWAITCAVGKKTFIVSTSVGGRTRLFVILNRSKMETKYSCRTSFSTIKMKKKYMCFIFYTIMPHNVPFVRSNESETATSWGEAKPIPEKTGTAGLSIHSRAEPSRIAEYAEGCFIIALNTSLGK